MDRLSGAAVCVLFTALSVNTAAAPFDDAWPAIVGALQKGEVTGAASDLQGARDACKRLLTVSSLTAAERALVRMAMAYADWRLVRAPTLPAAERDGILEEALAQTGLIIADEPKNAEALALRSSIYGAIFSFNPMSAVTMGQDAAEAIERALQQGPRNPRVLLQEALRLYKTPQAWGGDVVKAEATLRRSIAQFATEPADRPWPNWGRADAHIWLGQMLAERGDIAGARAEYNLALAAAPDHYWVKGALLPEINKKKPQ
jgi:tetratricopeptide (TPR) repeat protein